MSIFFFSIDEGKMLLNFSNTLNKHSRREQAQRNNDLEDVITFLRHFKSFQNNHFSRANIHLFLVTHTSYTRVIMECYGYCLAVNTNVYFYQDNKLSILFQSLISF